MVYIPSLFCVGLQDTFFRARLVTTVEGHRWDAVLLFFLSGGVGVEESGGNGWVWLF